MLDHLRALAVFAGVADAGSFTAAAKRLGISASVVSYHVTALERHLDTPLIYRTTRKLSLTAAGSRLAASARAMLREAEEGFGEIGYRSASATGSLKVTAPAILQYSRFITRFSTFIAHHAKIEISMSFSDERTDIVEDGFDLGFRLGQLEDSSLISRKLVEGRMHLCASPRYLAARREVVGPADLDGLEMIRIVGNPTRVTLTSTVGKPRKHPVKMAHRISVDSGFAARRMAEAGSGVVVLPDFFVREAMANEQLVEILPTWQTPNYGIYAVWPPNTGTNYLRTSFLNFIADIANTEPESDGYVV